MIKKSFRKNNINQIEVTCNVYGEEEFKVYVYKIPSTAKRTLDFDNITDFYDKFEYDLEHLGEGTHLEGHSDVSKGICSLDLLINCARGDDGKDVFNKIVEMAKEFFQV